MMAAMEILSENNEKGVQSRLAAGPGSAPATFTPGGGLAVGRAHDQRSGRMAGPAR